MSRKTWRLGTGEQADGGGGYAGETEHHGWWGKGVGRSKKDGQEVVDEEVTRRALSRTKRALAEGTVGREWAGR
jgi:hypothetical protein